MAWNGFALPEAGGRVQNSRIMQWLYLDGNQEQHSTEEEQLGDLVQNGSIQADTMLWNESMSDWQTAQSIWPETFQAEVAVPRAPTIQRPQGMSSAPKIKPRGSKSVKRPATAPATKKAASTASTARATSTLTKSRSVTKKGAEPEEENEDLMGATRKMANSLHERHGWIVAVAFMSMIFGSLVVLGGVAALVGKPGFLPVIPIVLGVLPIGVSILLLKAAGSAKQAVDTGLSQHLNESLESFGKYFLGIGIFLLIFLILIIAGIGMAIFSPGFFVPGA